MSVEDGELPTGAPYLDGLCLVEMVIGWIPITEGELIVFERKTIPFMACLAVNGGYASWYLVGAPEGYVGSLA